MSDQINNIKIYTDEMSKPIKVQDIDKLLEI